ncbi:MAG: hypothetical protein IMF18_06780 [Proteobacteria bacterium]|jgi:hypothetical protein|nr:hypothetical protein [Pseudomonadota bacterium]
MNDNKRRAIVWDTIERLAFRPNPPASWLGVYAKTLHRFWGVEPTRVHFARNDKFSVTFLNLGCCYSIDLVDKYSASFVHDSSDCLHWQTHVDPGFHSKASLQTTVGKYPSQQMDNKLRRDVDAVLDGMLFHPRCHAHIEDLGIRHVQLDQDRGGLSSHEVRIGGGIENPYVFLFHLRYQFCLVSDQVRQTERLRLIDLFEDAIKDKDETVNASKLFNF